MRSPGIFSLHFSGISRDPVVLPRPGACRAGRNRDGSPVPVCALSGSRGGPGILSFGALQPGFRVLASLRHALPGTREYLQPGRSVTGRGATGPIVPPPQPALSQNLYQFRDHSLKPRAVGATVTGLRYRIRWVRVPWDAHDRMV